MSVLRKLSAFNGVVLLPLVLMISLTFLGCATSSSSASKVTVVSEVPITVTGASTAYAPLEILARAFEKKKGGVRVTMLPDNQTAGGIMGARERLVDIGSVTRAPTNDEIAGVLRYSEFARDGLFVATHPGVTNVTNLTTENLRAIYSGSIQNWKQLGGPDASIVVLDRPEDESAKTLLRQYVLGKDLAISPKAIVFQKEGDLITAMKETPFSIGALSLAYAISNNLSVNRIAVDGIVPSVDEIRAGRYKMVRSLGIVWIDDASPLAKEYKDFVLGNEGAKLLVEKGYAPSSTVSN